MADLTTFGKQGDPAKRLATRQSESHDFILGLAQHLVEVGKLQPAGLDRALRVPSWDWSRKSIWPRLMQMSLA
jgi:hypothetical protein